MRLINYKRCARDESVRIMIWEVRRCLETVNDFLAGISHANACRNQKKILTIVVVLKSICMKMEYFARETLGINFIRQNHLHTSKSEQNFHLREVN